MKQTLVIISAIVFLQLCACNSGKKLDKDNSIKRIQVNPDKIERINMTDYFKYSSFIALETTDDNLIAHMNRVQFFDSKIYIMDGKQNIIFIFDENGKYLNKIYRLGGGPEEYKKMDDFIIDPTTGYIRVYDGMTGQVFDYSSKGEFLGKRKAPEGDCYFQMKNSKWLFYSGNGSSNQDGNFYNLHICDEDFGIMQSFLPFNKNLAGYRFSHESTKGIFSEYRDTVYILPMLSNNIYWYNEKTNEPEIKYSIIFSGQNISYIDENSEEKEVEKFRHQVSSGEIAAHIRGFYKLSSLVFFNFTYGGRLYYCLYDELTNQLKCDRRALLDENGLFAFPEIYWSDKGQNRLMSIVDGGFFHAIKERNKTNPVIQEISAAVNVEDPNPILVFYDVKR